MLKIGLILLIATLFVTGCIRGQKEIPAHEDKFGLIEAELPLKSEVLDSLSLSISGIDYVFVVDAECSTCLSVLIKELDQIELHEVSKVIVIVPNGTAPTVKYYLKDIFPDTTNKIIVLDEEVLIDKLYKYNGNYYKVVNGVCESGWQYLGQEW